jgi:four helix bundle protein
LDSQQLIKCTSTFAHRAAKLALALPKSILGRHISGQLIRCLTSVAENYRAAVLAQSRASFKAKLSIVLEEIDEAQF